MLTNDAPKEIKSILDYFYPPEKKEVKKVEKHYTVYSVYDKLYDDIVQEIDKDLLDVLFSDSDPLHRKDP